MKRYAHKTLLISVAILVVLLSLPVAALADGGGGENEFSQTTGEYLVTLIFENPVMIGKNQIHVRVSDAHHLPVSLADVAVNVVKGETEHTETELATQSEEASMTGMGGTSEQAVEPSPNANDEMSAVALEEGHESGEYAGEITIDNAGDWIIHVNLNIQGKLMDVDFPLNVASHRNGPVVLTVFFTLNAAILAVAAVIKPKPVAAKNEA